MPHADAAAAFVKTPNTPNAHTREKIRARARAMRHGHGQSQSQHTARLLSSAACDDIRGYARHESHTRHGTDDVQHGSRAALSEQGYRHDWLAGWSWCCADWLVGWLVSAPCRRRVVVLGDGGAWRLARECCARMLSRAHVSVVELARPTSEWWMESLLCVWWRVDLCCCVFVHMAYACDGVPGECYMS